MYYNVEYTVCYFYNPVSEECLCLGTLIHDKTTGKVDFRHISNFARLKAFNDEVDVEGIKKYLEELKKDAESPKSEPFIIEKYMDSPFKEIRFSEVIPDRYSEYASSYADFIAKTHFDGDFDKSERLHF